jgi:hypothetical protein
VRAVLFGVGLSKLPEYDISFVVFDHQQPKVEEYGRVKVYRHSYYKSYDAVQRDVALTASLSSHTRIDESSGIGSWNDAPAHVRRCQEAVSAHIRKAYHGLGLFVRKTPLIVPLDLLRTLVRRSLGINVRTSITANGSDSVATGDCEVIQPDTSVVYKEIDADIYCVFGVSSFVSEVAEFCKIFGKKLILFVGSDIDLDITYHNNNSYVNNSIMYADLIITQTYHQSRTIQDIFGRKSFIIKNPIELDTKRDRHGELVARDIALWIGKSDRIKRPEILLRLAERFQNIRFLMILNCADHEIFKKIIRSKPKNVEIIESIGFHDIESLFARAIVMINTSIFEGFPNTFLQAGKYGVPVLSLNIDPDRFIQNHNCGICANGDFDNLVD